MGKLSLHKLCQNKHFSIAGTVSPNSKRKKNIFLVPNYHSFQLFTWLFKTRFSFSVLRHFSSQPCNLFVFSSSSFLAGDLPCCSFEINTYFLWHSLSAIPKPVFRHEIRWQMSACFETQQTVIQSTPMAEFSFDFTDGSFLQLYGQK